MYTANIYIIVLFLFLTMGSSLHSQTCTVYNLNDDESQVAILMMSGPYADTYVLSEPGEFSQNDDDGTARLTGTVERLSNPEQTFELDINFINGSNWEEWSAMGRGYKDEPGVVLDNYLDYTYYEMDGSNSTLTGMGENLGVQLDLAHAPVNFYYGFQVGIGANATTAVQGLGGWFRYSSEAGDGQGDILMESDCSQSAFDCPELTANVGDSCDDDDPDTIGDSVNEECSCSGIPIVQASDNDDICNAWQIDIPACDGILGLGLEGVTLFTTNEATADGPTGSCWETNQGGSSSFDVWFTMVAPSSGILRLQIYLNSNTELTLYQANLGCEGELTEIACGQEDYMTSANSTILVNNLIPGDSLFLQVSNNDGYSSFQILRHCEPEVECPEVPGDIGGFCNDGDELTYNDRVNEACECVGIPYDCHTLMLNINNSCDDGDELTYNDRVNEACECIGIPYDCLPQLANIGNSCDDGWDMTYNDRINESCECIGTPYDCLPQLLNIGNNCDDGDDTTYNDKVKEDCECRGIHYFCIPELLIFGDNCDDGDVLTDNDEINLDCECVGIPYDCPSLVLNYGDNCDDGDDLTYYDRINEACECAGIPYDCPSLGLNIGANCFDGNVLTYNDEINEACECVGIPYDCPSLGLNIGANCDDGDVLTYNDDVNDDCDCIGVPFDCPALLLNIGANCDDGDALTDNDAVNESCECIGIPFDCLPQLLNFEDYCDDGDDMTYNDEINEDCECAGIPFDCLSLLLNIGDSCDDEDDMSYFDIVNPDCVCTGIELDCPRLLLNIGDSCTDPFPETENDVVTEDCICLGSIGPNTCGPGLEGVIVEKYYVANADDAASSPEGGLVEGATTYRVYLDLAPEYGLETVYGKPGHELLFSTTTEFYNHPFGTTLGRDIIPFFLSESTYALDSWLTFGGASQEHFGVLKTLDPDGSLIGGVNNTQGVLANNDPIAGLPLTESDGLQPGMPESMLVIGDLSSAISTYFGTQNASGTIITQNSAFAVLGGVEGSNEENHILIAQVTTDGIFEFKLNFRISAPFGPGSGIAIDYVHSNPGFNISQSAPQLTCDQLTYSSDEEVQNTNSSQNTVFSLIESAEIEVFPNPSAGESLGFVLRGMPAIGEVVRIYVTDVFGRKIFSDRFVNQDRTTRRKLVFPVPLENGLYLLRAEFEGSELVEKIVVNN